MTPKSTKSAKFNPRESLSHLKVFDLLQECIGKYELWAFQGFLIRRIMGKQFPILTVPKMPNILSVPLFCAQNCFDLSTSSSSVAFWNFFGPCIAQRHITYSSFFNSVFTFDCLLNFYRTSISASSVFTIKNTFPCSRNLFPVFLVTKIFFQQQTSRCLSICQCHYCP